MGLKRHEIAVAIATAAGDPASGPVTVKTTVSALSRQFKVTWSTMDNHLNRLRDESIVTKTGRGEMIVDCTKIPAPLPHRGHLRLVDTTNTEPHTAEATPRDQPSMANGPAPSSAVANPSIDALTRLGEHALDRGDHEAFAQVVAALAQIAAPSREIAAPIAGPSSQIAARTAIPANSEFERSENSFDSVPNELPKAAKSHDPRPAMTRDQRPATSRDEDSPLKPPSTGDDYLDSVLARQCERLVHKQGAAAEPSWMRKGRPFPGTWTTQDQQAIGKVWKAKIGQPLERDVMALLSLWTPTEAQHAIDVAAANDKLRNKVGRLRTASVLGYHHYYPTATADGLPHWDLWVELRNQSIPADQLQAAVERLSSSVNSASHPVRLAAYFADHLDALDDAASWGFFEIDPAAIATTISKYQGHTP